MRLLEFVRYTNPMVNSEVPAMTHLPLSEVGHSAEAPLHGMHTSRENICVESDNSDPGFTQKMSRYREILEGFRANLEPFERIYKNIHQNPELSRREENTAALISSELRSIGYEVHDAIGGYGLVGILKNGPGKVVMLRSELDALPIEEQTGLPYASTKRMKDWWGREQPVMHACGHDMHMVCLLAASRLLFDSKAEWSGTVVILYQPNEEHTGGAQAMLNDGLYERVPVPDIVMAQHLMQIPAGSVSIKSGHVLVSADTASIRIFSSEGYSANPQISINAAVVASQVIVKLNALVKKAPGGRYASIHVEEIHAGEPGMDWVPHVDLVLDVKAYDPNVRQYLHDAIKELVETEAGSSGAIKKPMINFVSRAPLTSNDIGAVEKVGQVFGEFFGPEKVLDQVPSHPCEDFSLLARAHGVPYIFWFLGRADPEQLDRAKKEGKILEQIPIEHSPFNAPLIHPTLETGMNALALATLSYLVKE